MIMETCWLGNGWNMLGECVDEAGNGNNN
jgi:hypothetical protein